jgi:uncharacterized protein YaaQ
MNTKLIVIILRGVDRNKLVHQLHDTGFRVTEFASMGGFLRRKNTTLLIGLPADRVEAALAIIRETCPTPAGSDEHSATIFVLTAQQGVTI